MIDKEYTELYKKGVSEPQPVLKPGCRPWTFKDRAAAFKAEVEKAAEKYNVKIDSGWIYTCDDDQVIIEDKLPPNDRLYYDTLTDQERWYYL